MPRSLNENFCANCGELAQENLEGLSHCAKCFVLLNELFADRELEEQRIEGMMDENELTFLLHLGELHAT